MVIVQEVLKQAKARVTALRRQLREGGGEPGAPPPSAAELGRAEAAEKTLARRAGPASYQSRV